MRKVFVYILGLIFVIACVTKTSNGHVKSDTKPVFLARDSQSIIETIETDSTAYLKKVGTEILNGLEISKIKEKYIFQLIDSVLVKDSTDRSFYFKVFNKIREVAKDNIAEEIGFYAKDYCRNFPDEFFCMTSSELKFFASEIGEIIRTEEEDPPQFAKDYILAIKEKCNPKYLQKVETFSKQMFGAMESRK